jgi:hypothetical protein
VSNIDKPGWCDPFCTGRLTEVHSPRFIPRCPARGLRQKPHRGSISDLFPSRPKRLAEVRFCEPFPACPAGLLTEVRFLACLPASLGVAHRGSISPSASVCLCVRLCASLLPICPLCALCAHWEALRALGAHRGWLCPSTHLCLTTCVSVCLCAPVCTHSVHSLGRLTEVDLCAQKFVHTNAQPNACLPRLAACRAQEIRKGKPTEVALRLQAGVVFAAGPKSRWGDPLSN